LKTSDALAALAAGAVEAGIGVADDDVNHEIQVSKTLSENAVKIDSIKRKIVVAKIRP
jgi:hypothetical protein